MEQLEGFVLPGNEKKVCILAKLLYGLKCQNNVMRNLTL